LCPGNLAERANGRLSQNRPLLELSPLRPKGGKACIRARDRLILPLICGSDQRFAAAANWYDGQIRR
jgi:hypothetical protein